MALQAPRSKRYVTRLTRTSRHQSEGKNQYLLLLVVEKTSLPLKEKYSLLPNISARSGPVDWVPVMETARVIAL
jgi:hypothetical protein